jgi:CBS domain-containing protein
MELTLEELRGAIESARDADTLRGLRDRIHEEARTLPDTFPPGDWNDWINTIHDGFIRFALRKAEQDMMEQGKGPPPVSYAMLLFGSGGRREQTLWSDQDNGLIYENPSPGLEEQVGDYFRDLGQTVVEILFRLGYPPCEGNVMCNQPLWGQSHSGWLSTLDAWMDDPNWENIRYLLIVADMRGIHGELSLVEVLKERVRERVLLDPNLISAMLRNTLKRKVSLGVLGNLIPERFGEDMGGIDIKYGAYIPIVNAIRLLAIRHGVMESGTMQRIAAMEQAGAAEPPLAAEWRDAFHTVLRLRSLTSNKLEDGYYQSSGVLPGSLLTKERKMSLKAALRTGQKLHKYVEKEIHALEMQKG